MTQKPKQNMKITKTECDYCGKPIYIIKHDNGDIEVKFNCDCNPWEIEEDE